MLPRDIIAVLIIGPTLVQAADPGAQPNPAVYTTTPGFLAAEGNPRLIGYTEVGTGGTFSPLYCPSGFVYTASDAYGLCCTSAFEACNVPTSCSSGTIMWVGTYTSYCGEGYFCSIGRIGGQYDALASTNPSPSITVVSCGSDSLDWTAWREVTHVKTATYTDGNPVFVVDTALSITSSLSSQSPMTSSSGSSDQSPSPTTANSPPKGNGLGVSTGALVGIVISAACSVIGLAFGIGFKIYKYRKEQKEKVAATGSG